MLHSRPRRIATGVAAVLGLVSCGSAGPPSSTGEPEPTTFEPAAVSLDATVMTFVGTSPGGVDVLLERDGTVQRTAAGVASIDGDELVPGRAFRVGSVSKPFVAVMVLQLVDEGIVDLDAPLSRYLPDTVVGADATIRQLLSHQSGIPNYTDQPEFFTDVLADRSLPMTPTEILSYVADAPLGPVGQFAYSNTNYILLGQLIGALDGTELNVSLQERVTGRVGLDHTTFDVGQDSVPGDLVGGWSPQGDTGDPASPYDAIASSAWSAGSLISTADDLAAFLAALAGGTLISADSLAEMTDTGSTGYGLGLFAVSFSPTQTGYGHSGTILGYTSTMAIDPATGDTLVILTNNDTLVADQLAVQVVTAE